MKRVFVNRKMRISNGYTQYEVIQTEVVTYDSVNVINFIFVLSALVLGTVAYFEYQPVKLMINAVILLAVVFTKKDDHISRLMILILTISQFFI